MSSTDTQPILTDSPNPTDYSNQQNSQTADTSGSYTLDSQVLTGSMSFIAGDMSSTNAALNASNNASATPMQAATGTYDQYFHAFAVRETLGGFDFTRTPNYQAESGNSYPALGAYQFDKASLIATGYYRDDGALSDSRWQDSFFTGRDNITSKQAFLNNPAVQDSAAREWTQTVGWKGILDLGLQNDIGQTIAGIHITAAALLGGTSLLGPDAVKRFITSGGQNDQADSYGTHISEYMANFSGFQTPFDPK